MSPNPFPPIKALVLLLAACFVGSSPAFSSESAKLASTLQPFVDDHSLAGAVVLVADKSQILDLEAVGYANVVTKEPMRPDALFWLASMTKPFTTTLLMMLVDEGKVNVDDPVEKYLPAFKGVQVAVTQDQAPAAKPPGAIQGYMIKDEIVDKDHVSLERPAHSMTVRNLLTHTSGIAPIKSPRQLADKDLVPLREAVAGYAKLPLKFDPGSKYEYSNHGIDTVARIIEVVSGMKYEDFMEKRLLKPLGMNDTTFWPSDAQALRLASAYEAADAQKNILREAKQIGLFTYPLSNRLRQPMPAAGLFSTASDVSVFCRMLLNGGVYEGHRYLSIKSLQQMTSTQTGELLNKGLNEDGYGFGWQTVHKLHPTDTGLPGPFGHAGAYGTEMWIEPQHSFIRIFMVQYEGGMQGEFGRKIKSAFVKATNEAFGRSKPAAESTDGNEAIGKSLPPALPAAPGVNP